MKKNLLTAVILAAFCVGPLAVFADYDKAAVDTAMKLNAKTFVGLSKTIYALSKNNDAKDFWTASQAFYTFAATMQPLLSQTPPKGSKADWDSQINSFVDTALKGVGACGEKNLPKIQAAFAEIQAAQFKGHTAFKD